MKFEVIDRTLFPEGAMFDIRAKEKDIVHGPVKIAEVVRQYLVEKHKIFIEAALKNKHKKLEMVLDLENQTEKLLDGDTGELICEVRLSVLM